MTEPSKFQNRDVSDSPDDGSAHDRRQIDVLREEVTDDLWRAIVRTTLKQAVEGDSRARAWLSTYLLPRPHELPPPDSVIEVVMGDWRSELQTRLEKGQVRSASKPPSDVED